jgi:hypothetical protein
MHMISFPQCFAVVSRKASMSTVDNMLIYDGECPYCSLAAKALERIDTVGALSWYDSAAQQFLDAQFDTTPFAMFLVDIEEKQVYAGRSAAEELAKRAGTPHLVSSLVRDNYTQIAEVVGLASGRGREPDNVHSVYQLTSEAELVYDPLVTSSQHQSAVA